MSDQHPPQGPSGSGKPESVEPEPTAADTQALPASAASPLPAAQPTIPIGSEQPTAPYWSAPVPAPGPGSTYPPATTQVYGYNPPPGSTQAYGSTQASGQIQPYGSTQPHGQAQPYGQPQSYGQPQPAEPFGYGQALPAGPYPPSAPTPAYGQYPPAGYAPGGYGSGGYGAGGYGGYRSGPQMSGNAITAFVLALVGAFACPIVASVVALVFAHIAKKEIDSSGGWRNGQSFVLAAKIISWVSIGFWGLFTLAYAAFFLIIFLVAATTPSSGTYSTPGQLAGVLSLFLG